MKKELNIVMATKPEYNEHINVDTIKLIPCEPLNYLEIERLGREFAQFLYNNASGTFCDGLIDRLGELENV